MSGWRRCSLGRNAKYAPAHSQSFGGNRELIHDLKRLKSAKPAPKPKTCAKHAFLICISVYQSSSETSTWTRKQWSKCPKTRQIETIGPIIWQLKSIKSSCHIVILNYLRSCRWSKRGILEELRVEDNLKDHTSQTCKNSQLVEIWRMFVVFSCKENAIEVSHVPTDTII